MNKNIGHHCKISMIYKYYIARNVLITSEKLYIYVSEMSQCECVLSPLHPSMSNYKRPWILINKSLITLKHKIICLQWDCIMKIFPEKLWW